MAIDYKFAFELLVDRLTRDALFSRRNTPNNSPSLTDEQINEIKEIAESCLEDAVEDIEGEGEGNNQ